MSSPHILYAEDDELILEIVQRFLVRAGYRVTPARGVAEGVAAWREGGIDLVVTDRRLVDGIADELIAVIRNEGGEKVPVILCTGYDRDISREQLLLLGIAKVITKPVLPEQLVEAIAAVLDPPSPA